eukprot:TRINITY_DN12447_c0_g1_i1.p1 TRINITY_DN12447_c0_g1~~TRINITY_DN12447_c0_g1_i1.p1  ORF type:complete len:428 (-),score=98.96 TRINITY_DN12447_c0_g1_i1:94-1377(-)
MMPKLLFLTLVVLSCLLGFALGSFSIPNPTLNPAQCGHPKGENIQWVCDPQRLISVDAMRNISNTIKDISQNSMVDSCSKPYQLAVLIVDSMAQYGMVPHPPATLQDAKKFARRVHDEWAVGFPTCQTGLVFFISVVDRQFYLSVGYDARPVVTDAIAVQIFNGMKKSLRANQFEKAILHGIKDLDDVIKGFGLQHDEEDTDWFGFLLVPLTFVVFFVLVKKCGNSPRETTAREECRKKLSKIDELKAQQLNLQFNPTHCPICLEDFPEEKDDSKDDSNEMHELNKEGLRSRKPSSMDTTLLRCGHKFCNRCIDDWLRQNTTCPICRKDVHSDDKIRDKNDQSQHSTVNRVDVDFYNAMMFFELGSLHRQYPTMVTNDMVSRWTQPEYSGLFSADTEVVSALSSYAAPSDSFGGGGADCAGGGGGSW